MATWTDRAACFLFPSTCIGDAHDAIVAREAGGGTTAASTPAEGGGLISEIADAGATVLSAGVEPLGEVRETVQWATVAIVACSIVILVLVGVGLFFYIRR